MNVFKKYKTTWNKIFIKTSDLSVELPFTLTHPKPEPIIETDKESINDKLMEPVVKVLADKANKGEKNSDDQAVPIDHNLIEFETR